MAFRRSAHVLVFAAVVAPMADCVVSCSPIFVLYGIVAVYPAVFTARRGYGNWKYTYKENGRNNDEYNAKFTILFVCHNISFPHKHGDIAAFVRFSLINGIPFHHEHHIGNRGII